MLGCGWGMVQHLCAFQRCKQGGGIGCECWGFSPPTLCWVQILLWVLRVAEAGEVQGGKGKGRRRGCCCSTADGAGKNGLISSWQKEAKKETMKPVLHRYSEKEGRKGERKKHTPKKPSLDKEEFKNQIYLWELFSGVLFTVSCDPSNLS